MKNTLKVIATLVLLTLALSTGTIALAEEETEAPVVVEVKEEKAEKAEVKEEKSEPKEEKVAVEEEVVVVEEVKEEKTEAVEASDEGSEMIFEEEQVPMSAGIIDISEINVVVNKSINTPKMGDKVKLSAELKTNQNLSGHKVNYQWQVDTGDGQGFRDLQKKANKADYSLKFSEKNMNYTWRVIVDVA